MTSDQMQPFYYVISRNKSTMLSLKRVAGTEQYYDCKTASIITLSNKGKHCQWTNVDSLMI